MKPLLTIAMILITSISWSQSDATAQINKAFSSGDAAAITNYLMVEVDLDIDGIEGVFTAAEVQQRLTVFFAKNKPASFSVKHQGTSKLQDHYRIGDLKTNHGDYRVTYFMKTSPKGMKIKQIRIERLD